jgi:hypothetical protein
MKASLREERGAQERLRGPPLHAHEEHQAQDSEQHRRPDLRGQHADVADAAEREHQSRHAEGERERPREVEAHLLARRLAQHEGGERQREEREEGLEDEDDAPAEQVDERAPGDEAEGRSGRPRHRPPAHGADAIFAVVDAEDERHRRRPRRRSDRRRQRADADQGGNVPGERRGGRRPGGEHEPGEEDPPVPPEIAELSEQRQRHRRAEHRRRDHPRTRSPSSSARW